MPESTSRKKKPVMNAKPEKAKAEKAKRIDAATGEELANPVWFKPVMFGFMLLGLVWIIVYYVTGAQYPLGAAFTEQGLNLENWNILIGFGIAMIGFAMSTKWK